MDQFLAGGVNSGGGFISILAVPEPLTWAMALAGFAALAGWRSAAGAADAGLSASGHEPRQLC